MLNHHLKVQPSYEHHFSSYMYVVKAAETYIRTKNSYVKMLMKLTPFLLIQTYRRHSSNLLQTFLNLLPTPISGADQASLILNADFL